jgi:hypothetical protein
MCLCFALLLAQIVFQFGSFAAKFRDLCIALAVLDHWAWLAAFAWMMVLAYDICSTMSSDTLIDAHTHAVQFRWFLGIAWGTPFVFVGTCLAVSLTRPDLLAYTDGSLCWISSGVYSMLVTVALPISIALVVNAVLFVWTLMSIRKAVKIAKRAQESSEAKGQLVVYVRLAALMGFTWVFGLLQNAVPHAAMRYAFIVCNALQGVFIFAAFICKARVLNLLRLRFKKKPSYELSKGTTTVTSI